MRELLVDVVIHEVRDVKGNAQCHWYAVAGVNAQTPRARRLRRNRDRNRLSHSLQLPPPLLQALQGLVAGRARAAGGAIAADRELATEGAVVVAKDHVAGASAADVVDGSGATEVALELLVEAEDGALAGAVDVAGAATAGGETPGGAGVQTGQRCWARCGV